MHIDVFMTFEGHMHDRMTLGRKGHVLSAFVISVMAAVTGHDISGSIRLKSSKSCAILINRQFDCMPIIRGVNAQTSD